MNEGLPNQASVCKPIVIIDAPTVTLGSDDSICPGGTKILDAGAGYTSYLWSTRATTRAITIYAPGTYWVEVVKWGCTVSDTVQITPALAPVITIAGNTTVYQGNTEIYTTQPGMTGYSWTFSAGGTLVSGGTATDNTITIQWNTLGAQWVKVNYTYVNGCPATVPAHLNVTVIPATSFTAPDTTCINQPVTIVNTTIGGTTFYWNFCSGNSSANPLALNIGNPGNTLNHPMYMTLVREGNDYFSFVTNQGYPGYVTRNYHGNSFRNNPSASVNMLQGGELDHSVEAIQIEKDGNGNWYGFENNNTTITRLDFGISLWNIPTTTDLGPFPNIGVAHGSAVVKEGNTWLGLFDSSPTANILSRLNFGTSLANIPTYENLGNVAGFSWHCQLAVVKENGLNYMLVINYSPGSLSRVSFGNSLLNTPTGENLGNCGAIISSTGITALNDCETSVGYYTVYLPVPNAAIGRLNFTGGIGGTVTATSLGNTGGFGRPDSFSEIFRQNDSIYAYVMNYDNSTLTRLSFPPCNNATPASSTLFTPPPVSYNQTGTYNIRLLVDEGLLTEASACRPIVVMDPPDVDIGPDVTICPNESRILTAGAGFSSYLWSTGDTTQAITVNSPGTYWVDAMKWGCTATDTLHITLDSAPDIDLGNDTAICDGLQVTFDAGACTGCTFQWSNLTNSQMNIGNGQTFTTDAAATYMVTVVGPNGCPGRDTVVLSLIPLMPVAVSVEASENPSCPESLVTFVANGTNEGSNPSYQWKVNGVNAGSNAASYAFVPLNGDLVSVVLTSTETCTSGNPATSIPVQMVITPAISLSVTISASQNPFCVGTPVTFTATPVAGLVQKDFQWKVNGNPQGSNSAVYTYIPADGDQVLCILSSTDFCVTGNPAASNTLAMAQNNNFPASVTISVSANPFCTGLPVTFTAFPANGGPAPSYQWKRNGANAGGNASAFTCNPLAGDSIRCIMTSNLACVTQNPANSNTIQMTTLPAPVVSFQACFDTITTVNAKPIRLRGGIPLGGIYTGAGVSYGYFYPAVAGPGNHLITYTYTNSALCTASRYSFLVARLASSFNCGENFIDVRDSTVYSTIQIGTQCWFAQNLIYGNEVPLTTYQRDNCIPERYVNPATSNEPRATSYQWDELMTYTDSEESQGLCPPGWHVPSEADWNQLFAYYQNNAFAGAPLKYSGYSGFNAFLNGAVFFNRNWYLEDFATFFWSSTSHGPYKAWAHGLNDYNYSVSYYPAFRANAFSVRCLKDQ